MLTNKSPPMFNKKTVVMITKDGRDTAIENLTADNYIVPKGEEKYYHAVIEVRQFDPKTGKRLSTPRVQKFGKKAFETHVQASLRKQGYTITILHDPNAWVKEQAEKAAAAKAVQAEVAAKAQQEKFDAAVAAAVAKALAERDAKDAKAAEIAAKEKAEREAAEAKAAAEEAERAKAEAKAKEEAAAQVGEQTEKKGPGRPKKEDNNL